MFIERRMHFKLLYGSSLLSSAFIATAPTNSQIVSRQGQLPAPIWSGQVQNPVAAYKGRRVFLLPDQQHVIIFRPTQKAGKETYEGVEYSLHNAIYPALTASVQNEGELLTYRYKLTNGKQSKDAISTFSMVIYPDPALNVGPGRWKGGAAMKVHRNMANVIGAPSGGLALWLCPKEAPLDAGQTTDFTVSSKALPGFTTAFTEHDPHIKIDESPAWPFIVLDELEPVLDLLWIDQRIITIGPRYSQNEARSKIASDYIAGIQNLTDQKLFDPDSTFIKEAVHGLREVSSGRQSALNIPSKPGVKSEQELFNALQLSLGHYH